jgi:hypothetical protein
VFLIKSEDVKILSVSTITLTPRLMPPPARPGSSEKPMLMEVIWKSSLE